MIPRVSAALRQLVVARAGNQCEYCHLSQVGQEATFHIDHVIPIAAGGLTSENNLALACVSCSLRKAARQAVQDPGTAQDVPIYNPRNQLWQDHFQWDVVRLVGRTPTGRATASALGLNRPLILAIRAEELAFGRHPPR